MFRRLAATGTIIASPTRPRSRSRLRCPALGIAPAGHGAAIGNIPIRPTRCRLATRSAGLGDFRGDGAFLVEKVRPKESAKIALVFFARQMMRPMPPETDSWVIVNLDNWGNEAGAAARISGCPRRAQLAVDSHRLAEPKEVLPGVEMVRTPAGSDVARCSLATGRTVVQGSLLPADAALSVFDTSARSPLTSKNCCQAAVAVFGRPRSPAWRVAAAQPAKKPARVALLRIRRCSCSRFTPRPP